MVGKIMHKVTKKVMRNNNYIAIVTSLCTICMVNHMRKGLEESQGLDAPGYEAMEEDELNLPDHCFGCAHREEELELARKELDLARKEIERLKGKRRSSTPYERNVSVGVPDKARV
jgi:hypothetical protein